MKHTYTAKKSIAINAPAVKVWEALITPESIKQYLFGTDAISDWKVGSKIIFKGVYNGKTYEDKGIILQTIPEKLFQHSFWSHAAGIEDAPENYATVTYNLEKEGNNTTKVTVSQDGCPDEKACTNSENFWGTVLQGLKNLLEN